MFDRNGSAFLLRAFRESRALHKTDQVSLDCFRIHNV
jgi:hypothetical protein